MDKVDIESLYSANIKAPDITNKEQYIIRLSSAEIGSLWELYMNTSLSVHTVKHFLEVAEDPEIRPVIDHALLLLEEQIRKITKIFKNDEIGRPIGFTDNDLNRKTPRLYSDAFALDYIWRMTITEISACGIALPATSRPDIYDFISESLNSTMELNKKAKDLLLSKGLFIKSPYVPVSDKTDFAKSKNYLKDIIGKKRKLNTLEIRNLFISAQRNLAAMALLTGFSQVAQLPDVRQYFLEGMEITRENIKSFASFLTKNDLAAPYSWDLEVTSSITPPFSDKLMVYHVMALVAEGLRFYGNSIGTDLRNDLSSYYLQIVPKVAKYRADGSILMIKNGWMEEPPQLVDREELRLKH